MDTEKVIALGFVIHQLLGFIGGIVLCYFGYRLLMKRVKGRQREAHRGWKAARALIKNAAPGLLFALFGAGAIWLTAANRFAPKVYAPGAYAPKADLPELAAKPLPTGTADGNDDRLVMTLRATRPEMNLVDRGTIPEDYSTVDHPPTPALSPPSPAPVSSPTPKAAPSSTPNATPASAPKEPSGSARKTLEKERREAERKRSRLEDMYQKHLISSEAYKKGEEEYKNAILKYRSEVNVGGSLEQ
jgi:hypothetical protein